MNKKVSLVITSCDRFDLLEKTLESFFKFNTYKLNQIIIIEDSGREKALKNVIAKFPHHKFTLLINKKKLGQLKSIDKAYSFVNSEYIFHCEDDWIFIKEGFIEKSIEILEDNPKILSVWLRNIEELKNLSFSNDVYKSKSDEEYKLAYDEILSFNPSLRRIKEYKSIENYTKYFSSTFESDISSFYKKDGFVSAILLNYCVEHLGWHRRIADIHKNKSKFGAFIFNRIRRIKASFYKKLSLGKFKK